MKMRNFLLLLVAALVFVFVACSKEKSSETGIPPGGTPPTDTVPAPGDTTGTSPGNVTTEAGSWKFISVQATGSQTAEFSQAGIPLKAVTATSFTTQNNSGTVTFDNSKMTATGVTFSVNTNTTTYIYQGPIILDSLPTPLNQTVPPQTAASDYQKIGTDSLNFQNGGFLNVLTGGLLPNAPTGCKVSFSGNTMKMTIRYDTVTTQDFQGIPAKINIHMVLVATLQKQ